jgi:hypothetical protein
VSINTPSDVILLLTKAISALQNPTPITPEQFRDIEGREYPENGAVYRRGRYTGVIDDDVDDEDGCSGWVLCTYKSARDGFDEEYYKKYDTVQDIVCAYNLIEPPSRDWRPE